MMFLVSAFSSLLVVISVIVWTPVVMLMAFTKNQSLVSWSIQSWSRFVLRALGVKTRIHGIENYSKDVSCLVISNHQSLMDVPALVGLVPGHLRMVAKKELFKIPVFGWGMKAGGCISLDRTNHGSGKEVSDQISDRIKHGLQIWVAPEGTRSRDGSIGEFKKGSFAVAIEAKVPVQPIVISGAIDILNRKTLLPRFGGTIDFSFLPPIDTRDYSIDDRAQLAQRTRDVIVAEYARLLKLRNKT